MLGYISTFFDKAEKLNCSSLTVRLAIRFKDSGHLTRPGRFGALSPTPGVLDSLDFRRISSILQML